MSDTASSEKEPKKEKKNKSLMGGAGSFLKGLAGSIEDSNNEVKGFDDDSRVSVLDVLKRKKPEGPPYKHIDDYAWTKYIIAWSNLDIVIMVVFTILIWVAAHLSFNRPLYEISSHGTIGHQLEDYSNIPELEVDMAVLWTVSTIQLLHQVDLSGKPFISKLLGQVNPNIIQRFTREYERSRVAINRHNMVKNVNITRPLEVFVNEEDKRITVYLSGYVIRSATESLQAGGPPPRLQVNYLAEAVIQAVTPSVLSPNGFFLERLTEKFGEEADMWAQDLQLNLFNKTE